MIKSLTHYHVMIRAMNWNLFIKIVFLFNLSVAVASFPIHREPMIVVLAVILLILFRFLMRQRSEKKEEDTDS
jgi:hypothetical protein